MTLLQRAIAGAVRAAERARHDLRRTRRVFTDPGARPALLYLLALGVAASSFLLFLLDGGGTPTGVQIGLLIGSFGVVLYMSLGQAGSATRRER